MNRPCILVAALALSLDVSAIGLSTATGRMGVAVLYDSTPASASPLLNTWGGSVSLELSPGSIFAIEPSLDVFWTTYGWLDDRAVPAASEDPRSAFVIGLLLDVPFTAAWRVNDWFSLAGGIGLSGLFRISFLGDPTEEWIAETRANVSAISAYFYRNGRFFYPSAIIRGDIALQDQFAFSIGIRGFLPVFNAWDATGLPFWDHGMLQIGLSMRVKLK